MVTGLEREMVEETGVAPEVGELIYIQQFIHKTQEQIELFFHIKNWSDYKSIDLSKTSHGAEEIEEVGFIDTKAKVIQPAFLSELDLLADIEAKGPVKVFNYIK